MSNKKNQKMWVGGGSFERVTGWRGREYREGRVGQGVGWVYSVRRPGPQGKGRAGSPWLLLGGVTGWVGQSQLTWALGLTGSSVAGRKGAHVHGRPCTHAHGIDLMRGK